MVGKDLVAESPYRFKRTLYVGLFPHQTMHDQTCKFLHADSAHLNSSLRHFRTDSMKVHKGIAPSWTSFFSASGASFSDLKLVYAATANSQGLVHAMAGGPVLSGNKCVVHLYPVDLRYDPSTVTSEEVVRAATHGLAALHKVNNIGYPSLTNVECQFGL